MEVTWFNVPPPRSGESRSSKPRGRGTVRWQVSAADRARLDRLWVPARRGARETFELKVRKKSGAKRWVPVTASFEGAAPGRGAPVARLPGNTSEGAAIDSEDRERQPQGARLRHLAVVGRLSGALAHELTQHLTSILSNAQAAQRLLSGDQASVEKMRAILTDIINADTHANDVIQRIGSLLKRRETKLEAVDLSGAIREATGLVSGELAAQRIQVVTQVEPDVPVVKGDRVQIEQILLNLLLNGAQAMQRTRPERRRMLIRVRRAGTAVEVAVEDAGAGLKESQRERVFEAFYTTKKNGLGLGLWICKAIVAAHRGRMWITRNEGAGITVHFTLRPCKPAAGRRSAGRV
jgi:C4-dicarboxylate-specific signal transduction histidine kinase